MALCLFGALEAAAQTGGNAQMPSIFLGGANVPRAKALALDAALIKGWDLARSARDHVIFEVLLDEPASDGPPNAAALGAPGRTLLRIRADFAESGNGVAVTLRADEIWYQGRSYEWQTDVTRQYRSNLMNALNSLRAQWVQLEPSARQAQPQAAASERRSPTLIERMRALTGTKSMLPQTGNVSPATARSAQPQRAPASMRAPTNVRPAQQPRTMAAPTPSQQRPLAEQEPPKGVWAYYAEQYAVERGCKLADLGAVLDSQRDDVELHRVYCASGTVMAVRCTRERCGDSR